MAVWSYSPQDVLAETIAVDTTVTQVSPGSAIAGQKTPTIVRAWQLRYSLVDTATVRSMAAFFTTQQGPFTAFDFFNPNTLTTHRVRFDSGMAIDLFAPGFVRGGDVRLMSAVGS